MDKYSEALSHGQSLQGSGNGRVDTEIKDSVLRTLWDTLHESNRFVQNCQIIGRAFEVVNNQNYPEDAYEPAEIAFTPEVIGHINSTVNVPHLLDVAAVTDETIVGNRVIRFKVRGSSNWSQIPGTHEHIEPLSYPLFFLNGEDGWGKNISKEVHFSDYIVSRMLMPEEGLYFRNAIETKWILSNRFQLFARLGQYWLVDSVSRNIDYRLDWVKKNQDYILGKGGKKNEGDAESLNNEIEEIEPNAHDDVNQGMQIDDYGEDHFDYTIGHHEDGQNENAQYDDTEMDIFMDHGNPADDQPAVISKKSEKTYLGANFHGSRRHLRNLSINGLIVVSERGEPHLFNTLTTNTEWPELKEQLLYGQTAFDRLLQLFFKKTYSLPIMVNITTLHKGRTLQLKYSKHASKLFCII